MDSQPQGEVWDMEVESETAGRTWVGAAVGLFLAYILASGPLYAILLNDPPDPKWFRLFELVYMPVNWIFDTPPGRWYLGLWL